MSTFSTILAIILAAAWLVRVIERTLFHVALWQRKEYRWDRMRAHLKTREGLMLLFGALLLIVITLFYLHRLREVLSSKAFFWGDREFEFLLVSASYPLLIACLSIARILRRGLVRPVGTIKALTLSSLLIIAHVATVTWWWYMIRRGVINIPLTILLILLPLFIPLIVALSALLLGLFSRALQNRAIRAASIRMREHPEITVVGITGSYGKSSAKEFLATILAEKYNVIKTPKNHNSAIGIAQTILREVGEETQPTFFIAEIGAYTKGEITRVARIINPTIGVITAVNEQHLALFGKTVEDVKQAKYELIEALPDNGTAVFNLDNPHTRALAEKTKKKTITYAIERPADVRASAITIQSERLSFSVVIASEAKQSPDKIASSPSAPRNDNDKKQHITANLAGALHVPNLLAAITVAHTLSMTLPEIAAAVQKITPIPKTMEVVHHNSGALIIDDSYSANPDGVIAALDHLAIIPRKKKVLVMMPMIELGTSEKDAHRRVAERIAHVCDEVIWTKRDYYPLIRDIATRNGLGADHIHHIEHPQRILEALAPFLTADSVILLENRIPTLVADTLRKTVTPMKTRAQKPTNDTRFPLSRE